MAFGVPTSKRFVITFNYWVNDQLYTGEFRSAKAIPQGTLFELAYNPDDPHHHAYADTPATAPIRNPILAIGIIGSIILSFAWFLVLRGCRR